MCRSVRNVAHVGVPSQMPWVRAAEMPITTRMSCFMLRGWRLTMSSNTHCPRRRTWACAITDDASTVVASAKWPLQTVVSLITLVLLNPSLTAPVRLMVDIWATVLLESREMSAAVAMRLVLFPTPGYFADSIFLTKRSARQGVTVTLVPQVVLVAQAL